MISDWIASQNPYWIVFYASGYGLLVSAAPETMAIMQNMVESAGAAPDPVLNTISGVIKTVVTILVGLSLFVLQTLKACELGIKLFKNWRAKPERDENKEGEE